MVYQKIDAEVWSPPVGEIRVIQEEAAGRNLVIDLYDHEVPLDLTGKTVSIFIQKPDDSLIYNFCAVSGNTVTAVLTFQMMAAFGKTKLCELQIIDENGRILKVTLPPLVIVKSNYDEAVESTDEFSVLASTIAEAKAAIENANRAAEEASTSADEKVTERINQAADEIAAAVKASCAEEINQAASDANAATENANQAMEKATESGQTAGQALEAAATATQIADQALEKAEESAQAAEQALEEAASANQTANQALENAKTTAEEAATEKINTLIAQYAGAGAHNGLFRGKSIQDKYEDGSLFMAIQNGTFEDLYIGDYFDITISTKFTSSEQVRCLLAGFDIYWNHGDLPLRTHHAVIVPKNAFAAAAQMNTSDDTTGAYLSSNMRTAVLTEYSTALSQVFGSHCLSCRDLSSSGTTSTAASMAGASYTGASTMWSFVDSRIRLLSEPEVFGITVVSSSFFDIGTASIQLPLFRLDPAKVPCALGGAGYVNGADTGSCLSWWLSGVSSATRFVAASATGCPQPYEASANLGVRPRWLIG